MKVTLDRLCITSGRLCDTCLKRLDSGAISDIDIKLGEILLNAGKSQKYLHNIAVTKIIETSNAVYLVTKKGDVEKLERARKFLEPKLSEVVDKGLYFLEKTKNEKKLLEILLSPVIPVGNSTVILPPEGNKEIKVQIKSSDRDRLTIEAKELSEITQALLKKNAFYAFV